MPRCSSHPLFLPCSAIITEKQSNHRQQCVRASTSNVFGRHRCPQHPVRDEHVHCHFVDANGNKSCKAYPIYGNRLPGAHSTHCFQHKLQGMVLHRQSFNQSIKHIRDNNPGVPIQCASDECLNLINSHPLCPTRQEREETRKTKCAFESCLSLTPGLYCTSHAAADTPAQAAPLTLKRSAPLQLSEEHATKKQSQPPGRTVSINAHHPSSSYPIAKKHLPTPGTCPRCWVNHKQEGKECPSKMCQSCRDVNIHCLQKCVNNNKCTRCRAWIIAQEGKTCPCLNFNENACVWCGDLSCTDPVSPWTSKKSKPTGKCSKLRPSTRSEYPGSGRCKLCLKFTFHDSTCSFCAKHDHRYNPDFQARYYKTFSRLQTQREHNK